MQKIAFAAFVACGIGMMVNPALADSNVTIQVQNQFGSPITYQGSSCTSATCPNSFPTPIAAGATSAAFTATSTTGNTAMMRVDYGAGNNVCRFTAQTSKRFAGGGCESPVTTAFASSGQAACAPSGTYQQNPTTCDLSVTFKISPK